MKVCYLDPDDEITSAVARVRTAEEQHVALVLPPGSRIASGRINFRLLAREAQSSRRTVVIVSGDSSVRALAVSAGLLAYGTVDQAETALADGDARADASGTPTPAASAASAVPAGAPPVRARPDAGTTERAWVRRPERIEERDAARAEGARSGGWALAPRSGPSTSTRTNSAEAAAIPVGAADRDRDDDGEWLDARGDPRRRPARRAAAATGTRRARRLLPLLVVLALAGTALAGAYLYLPTASITLRPVSEPVGPLTISVTADPSVAVSDPEAGLIPAERVEMPISVTDDFPATGTAVSQTRATGRVTFTSENTLLEVPVPEGTTVTTASGVAFVTTEPLVLPRASFATGPATASAEVRAERGGPAGNVDARTISRVPASLTASLVTVINEEATSGGRRVERTVITEGDYEAAVTALTGRLDDAAAESATDPSATPRGLTVYPDTARHGKPTADPPKGDVVDTRAETFTLTLSATATVLAVDERELGAVAASRLREELPREYRLFDESLVTDAGSGVVEDGRIVYRVDARAQRWRPIDRQQVLAAVKGKKVSDARAILQQYGAVDISAWPEFVDTIPTQEGRISMSILDPQPTAP